MRRLAGLRHPCIATLMGAVRLEGWPGECLLVMELMELGSLWDLLRNRAFAYDVEVPIMGPVFLLVKYEGRSK